MLLRSVYRKRLRRYTLPCPRHGCLRLRLCDISVASSANITSEVALVCRSAYHRQGKRDQKREAHYFLISLLSIAGNEKRGSRYPLPLLFVLAGCWIRSRDA